MLVRMFGGRDTSSAVAQGFRHSRYVGAKNSKLCSARIFYIEIQNHNIAEQKIVLPHLIRLAKENGVKIVATNDAHYLTKEDSKMQKVLMAISFHSTLVGDDDGGARGDIAGESVSDDKYFPTEEFYVKSYDEMYKALPYEDALDVTIEIADKCDPYFIRKEPLLPSYTPPDGLTTEEYLPQAPLTTGSKCATAR